MSAETAPEAAPRLYLVTPHDLAPEQLAAAAERLLAGGAVACLRLDLGAAGADAWLRAANLLLPLAHAADVPLVAADRPELVEQLGLDGVHLGPGGAALGPLRKRLGKDAILGGFGGSERHRAMSLAEAGADYVALGPLHGPDAATDELFAWWSEMIEVPVVAEGGLTPEDAARLAGITDFLVPGAGVWTAEDPAAALAAYVEAIS
ncbi:thiamine phosphate synthase [Paralimibaculum aggregatum]|uniref:Thiamine phosphate synthase n=1 Tax=Paralimibaculum aggregatum TaxID=3036245 RepID=A0ABQ6LKZ6_9RHOB|nr:thiamine phosphate synthase [Limibaculum sp. NKW23]GMG81329.1 thiamine phosphate synthase [Limibaculum sp. NKW23]